MEETRNEKASRDSRDIVGGLRFESAGPAVPAVAYDAYVRASESGGDHSIAWGWLHGPSDGRRERPARIYFGGGRKIPHNCGPAYKQGDPRDQRALGHAQEAVLSSRYQRNLGDPDR